MDSLTQIVLGAACGEVVAGKKIGNRAMLWGGIGGTIPDLDVFASFFTDEIAGTSFHRGFMHSFLFAVLAPWLLAWSAQWFYRENIYRKNGYKATALVLWLTLYGLAALGINLIPRIAGGGWSAYVMAPTVLLGVWLTRHLWRNYWQSDLPQVGMPYRYWVALFFWSIFTHPILDCFTSWGTQIWQPFNDLRVQWCTVSVVDPVATVPFLLLLLIATRFRAGARMRSAINWMGLAWFCAYLMVYTVWHKREVTRIFEASLQAKNIRYQRLYTNPTIFNNILWSGIAEGDTAYYFGQYGFNDRKAFVDRISTIPKNHSLLGGIAPDDRALRFLRWFSNGYYSVRPYRGDTLQVSDLRFGLMGDTLTGNNYVFPMLLFKNEKGAWDIKINNRSKEHMEESKHSLSDLWKRVIHGKQ